MKSSGAKKRGGWLRATASTGHPKPDEPPADALPFDEFFPHLLEGLRVLAGNPEAFERMRMRGQCFSEDAPCDAHWLLYARGESWANRKQLNPEMVSKIRELASLLEPLWNACDISPCWKNTAGAVDPVWDRIRLLAADVLVAPGGDHVPVPRRGL